MAPPPQLPVLVVDDDPTALKFVTTLLKKEGITTVESDTGYAAFTYLEKQLQTSGEVGVAGILSDWKMPGWDGLKLLHELRGHPVFKVVPFILVSGAVTRPELEVAAKQGANGLLLKPFDQKLLIAKVKELFYKS